MAATAARRGTVGTDLPSDICLAAPGRALASVRSGESLTKPPVRAPRRLRIAGGRAGDGAAAGGRFFSRSDIDLVGKDARLSQTWLAATAGGGFSASAFDISAESKRALNPPKFNPHEALEQLRTHSLKPYKSPHAVPERRRHTGGASATTRSCDRKPQKRNKNKRGEAAFECRGGRPYALQTAPEQPRVANLSPQRRPTSAVHRPTSAAPRPIVKGRAPWRMEGDRPMTRETQPSRATGPTLQAGPRRRHTKRRGDSARRRGRPSTAAPGSGQTELQLTKSADAFDLEESFATRPSTAPSGGRSRIQPTTSRSPSPITATPSRSPSPTDRDRTRIEANLSYSRALAATAGDAMVAAGAVGSEYVGEPTTVRVGTVSPAGRR